MTPEQNAECAINAVLKYLRESNIADETQRQAWIAKVFDAVKARTSQVN